MAELYDRSIPWQEKGRWYELFIESDGDTIKLTKTDLPGAVLTGNYVEFPKGFTAIDFKHAIHLLEGQTTANFGMGLRLFSNGSQGLLLPAKNYYDYTTVYVFGFFE